MIFSEDLLSPLAAMALPEYFDHGPEHVESVVRGAAGLLVEQRGAGWAPRLMPKPMLISIENKQISARPILNSL